jgi:hypothetical protein
VARAEGVVIRSAALIVVFLLAPAIANAHGLDPASLALREIRAGVFEVRWRVSTLRVPGAEVAPVFPSRCRQAVAADAVNEGDRLSVGWTIECGPQGLGGGVVGVDGLAAAKINALLTIERLDGESVQTMLGPSQPSFAFAAEPSRAEVMRRYLRLGLERITRPEHLLFVVALLMLAWSSRRLAQTLVAFALAHSLALTAATLGLVTLPAGPAALLIALSVLALAVELTATPPTLLRRFPSAIAVVFGLAHGFGFAGALAETRLPARDVPLALAAFNGGIELGQLMLVAAILAAVPLARRLPAMRSHAARPAVYVVGILSAFWCFERVAAFFG